MAKTVDELGIKITVDGADRLDQATASLKNLEKSGAASASTLNGLRFQNVAYQLQDMAVQAEMGTSWFRILGQQLPQLLSGFGPLGAAVGTVAAIALPLLSVALKGAGIDMRTLKEQTDDLGKANDAFLAAQKQNQTTLAGLGSSYGALTEEAKKFYEIRERLTEAKAQRENIDLVNELKKSYSELSKEAIQASQDQVRFAPQGVGAAALGQWYKEWRKGVTQQQGIDIAEMLKEIDAASPEKTVEAINNVLIYLEKAGPEAKKFKEAFEKTVEPLMKVNEELIKNKTNIREAAEQASKYQTEMSGIQNAFQPDINAAKRNFSQITAFGLEGKQKLAEFDRQMLEKNKDGVNRSAEIEAGRLRIQQETNDKVKDFTKNQSEAYRSITLTNDGKLRSLELESQLNKISDEGRYTLAYQLQYQQDITRNSKEYQDTLITISEQLRKNLITSSAAKDLEAGATAIRERADQVAAAAMQKRVNDAKDVNNAVLFEMDAKQRGVGYDIEALRIRAQMRNAYPEDIDAAVKVTALKNAQLEAETKLNREVALGKITSSDALDRMIAGRQELEKSVELEKERYAEVSRYRTATFGEGLKDSVSRMTRDNLTSYQQAMKMVESIYSNLGTALDKFVETGKFKFGDFRKSVIQDLLKIQVRATATNILGYGSSLFGLPGRASGGPVSSNTPYIVGEKGPELFIPQASGTIVPNNALPTSPVTAVSTPASNTIVNYNINAVDAQSFKQMIAADPSFLYAVSEQGRRRIPGAR